jgi:transposase InsO family protein
MTGPSSTLIAAGTIAGLASWLFRMHNAKLIRSMSRKGCSPDNAACEGCFGRLKTELFYPVGTGRLQPLSNSFRSLTPTSAGITKSASRSPLAHSVLSNTERASDLRHKPVQDFCRTPTTNYQPPFRTMLTIPAGNDQLNPRARADAQIRCTLPYGYNHMATLQ